MYRSFRLLDYQIQSIILLDHRDVTILYSEIANRSHLHLIMLIQPIKNVLHINTMYLLLLTLFVFQDDPIDWYLPSGEFWIYDPQFKVW